MTKHTIYALVLQIFLNKSYVKKYVCTKHFFLVTLFIFASVLFQKPPPQEITLSVKERRVKSVHEASHVDSARFLPTSEKDPTDSGERTRVLANITHLKWGIGNFRILQFVLELPAQ